MAEFERNLMQGRTGVGLGFGNRDLVVRLYDEKQCTVS